VPNRWSVSSWPKAGGPYEIHVVAATAIEAAIDVLIMIPSLASM
jgi:hypothetical protein